MPRNLSVIDHNNLQGSKSVMKGELSNYANLEFFREPVASEEEPIP